MQSLKDILKQRQKKSQRQGFCQIRKYVNTYPLCIHAKTDKINKQLWYTDDLDDTINNHTFQFNWVKM